MNRRDFLASGVGAVALASAARVGVADTAKAREPWDPERRLVAVGKPLRVQPVLLYNFQTPKEKASWRSWSKISTPEAAAEEVTRIGDELKKLAAEAPFPLELLPLKQVTSVDEAAKVHAQDYDVVLLYPATGTSAMLRGCFPPAKNKDVVFFVRQASGPVYYWYEALSTRLLKKNTPEEIRQNSAEDHGGPTVDDVVVDDYAEVLWRLNALFALKNFVGHRIVALGGPAGKYDGKAPEVARTRFKIDIVDVGYDDFTQRIKAAQNDRELVAQAEAWTERYLAMPQTILSTQKRFVTNAFLLYCVFKDYLAEHQTAAITIQGCMGQAIPIAETTACMTLSWLNDEGYLAFCESDFVIMPPGMFLRYIAGTPVFMHNSTFPHQGLVTCAHCTAPRRMDGQRYEPTRILTHYESDYGAAPKVDIPIGQQVTFVDPEYATGRWLGFTGVVKENPFYEICRSQQNVEIQGDWKRLVREVRDSHWMMVYGNHLAKLGYAARKLGLDWTNLSET